MNPKLTGAYRRGKRIALALDAARTTPVIRNMSSAIRNALNEYLNNRASQKATKEALRQAGVSEGEISQIDWSKSYFDNKNGLSGHD